jgi:hypothetical protein
MTQTFPAPSRPTSCPRRRAEGAARAAGRREAESLLRELAYVYQLTRSVKESLARPASVAVDGT